MALGAQHQTLTGMFVRHGLALTGIGVACGLAVAIVVMRLMSSLLFKVSPVDPVAYLAACLSLVATAFLASYLPSRRAATVDPVEARRRLILHRLYPGPVRLLLTAGGSRPSP